MNPPAPDLSSASHCYVKLRHLNFPLEAPGCNRSPKPQICSHSHGLGLNSKEFIEEVSVAKLTMLAGGQILTLSPQTCKVYYYIEADLCVIVLGKQDVMLRFLFDVISSCESELKPGHRFSI